MAVLDFPATPNVGDLYDGGTGVVYEWTGTHWKAVGDHGASCTIGAIVAWASENIPSGWLECNGAAIPVAYQRLIALIGDKTPDLRGEFVRGWDHGKGTDAGRGIKTSQNDSTKKPNSAFSTGGVGNHSHTVYNQLGGAGSKYGGNIGGTASQDVSQTAGAGAHSHSMNGGDAETRPRNVALMYIINADGTTSIGPDDRYVLKTGDTMTGNLDVVGAKVTSDSTVDSDPGKTLVTKDYVDNGQLPGFRNIIINGAVTINQRGKTYGAVNNNQYWADRWKKVSGGMTQVIENGNYKPNSIYTLSGVGVTTQQVTSPGSGHWTIPTISSTATKIQLELGKKDTTFEQRPIGLELSLCKRYYEAATMRIRLCVDGNDAVARFASIVFTEEKRAIPTWTRVYESDQDKGEYEPPQITKSGVSFSRKFNRNVGQMGWAQVASWTADAEL